MLRDFCRFGPSGKSHFGRRKPARKGFPVPRLEILEDRLAPSTYTVTNTSDSGSGSLRQAILDANGHSGADTIAFAISSGHQTIIPHSALPNLTDTVTVDGSTQPGFAGMPLIEIDGASAGSGSFGINIKASSCVVEDLVVNRFGEFGIYVQGNDNLIEGDFVGTNAAGTAAAANLYEGIYIAGGSGNTIGGTTAAARNLISGNGKANFKDNFGSHTLVEGNFIGTDVTGTKAVPNTKYGGIFLNSGAHSDTIGGTTPGAGNLISGNKSSGIGLSSSNTLVEGNEIGTSEDGTATLANGGDGVDVSSGANGNTIGGTAPGAGNLISGNTFYGIKAAGNHTLVEGNRIGTNAAGTSALGNGRSGVLLDGTSSGCTIGGTASGAGNVLSGNANMGVFLDSGVTNNLVAGNLIGTDATGTVPLGNLQAGILLHGGGTTGNTIGGTAAGAGNVIGANGTDGVLLNNGASANLVEGNFIGDGVNGTLNLGNVSDGVTLYPASNNTIGGSDAGAGNSIAFNGGRGVNVISGTGDVLRGNALYANTTLGIDLGGDGVTLNDSLGHTGPNDYQNFPVLSYALANANAGTTLVQGSLGSTANTTFQIDFYADPAADPSGYGQGQTYLGSTTVTTDGSGNVSFSVTLAGAVAAGQVLSATATDPGGNTSEFCQDVVAHGTDTWTGGAGLRSTNWSDAANWDHLPQAGDALVFPAGTGHLLANNDFAAGTAFYSLTIGDSYTLTGNALGLLAGVTASVSSGTASFQIPLTLEADQTFTVTSAGTTLDLTMALDGAAALTISGAGVVRTDGTDSYTGGTTVNGTLLVTGGGALPAGGPGTTVNVGGTLEGTGNIGDVSLAGGTLSPGGSKSGKLSAETVSFAAGSTLAIDLDGSNPGSGYDQLNASGPVNLGGATLALSLGFLPTGTQSFTLLTSTALSGTFNGLANGTLLTVGLSEFQISYTSTSVVLTHVPASQFFFSGPTGTTAGATTMLTLTAEDMAGNIIRDFTGTVNLSSSDPKATFPKTYTFTTGSGGDDGVHTFSVHFKTAGSQTFTANDMADGLSGMTTVQVKPAKATHFLVSAPTSVAAGTPFSITVTTYDAFGNVATAYRGTVHFISSDMGSGVMLPHDYTFVTKDHGAHTFTGVVLVTVGSQTITATDQTTSTIQGSATIMVTGGPNGPDVVQGGPGPLGSRERGATSGQGPAEYLPRGLADFLSRGDRPETEATLVDALLAAKARGGDPSAGYQLFSLDFVSYEFLDSARRVAS